MSTSNSVLCSTRELRDIAMTVQVIPRQTTQPKKVLQWQYQHVVNHIISGYLVYVDSGLALYFPHDIWRL